VGELSRRLFAGDCTLQASLTCRDLRSKQVKTSISRQNICILENKPAKHHTLSNSLEGKSPNAIPTENFVEDSDDEPLNQNLEPQYEDSCKEDSEDEVSLL
jgi:hypothetical protein